MDWVAIIENTARGLFGEQFIYFGLAALGLNIHFGYTGLLNLGQAVFMAAGAYGLSMSVVTLGLNFWWGLLSESSCSRSSLRRSWACRRFVSELTTSPS